MTVRTQTRQDEEQALLKAQALRHLESALDSLERACVSAQSLSWTLDDPERRRVEDLVHGLRCQRRALQRVDL